jgi:hypothetical protein
MEILGFQVKRKDIGKQTAETVGDFLDTVASKIGCRLEIADCGLAGTNCLVAYCSLLLRIESFRLSKTCNPYTLLRYAVKLAS